jgi:hypothetical protein
LALPEISFGSLIGGMGHLRQGIRTGIVTLTPLTTGLGFGKVHRTKGYGIATY